MLVKDALEGSRSALLGCHRLLAGREAFVDVHSTPTEMLYNSIRQVFGSGVCVAKELIAQGHSVISLRALHHKKSLLWFVTWNAKASSSNPTDLLPEAHVACGQHFPMGWTNETFRLGIGLFLRKDMTLQATHSHGEMLLRCYAMPHTPRLSIFRSSFR